MDKNVNQQLADKMNEKMRLNKIILGLKGEIETYQKGIDEKNKEIETYQKGIDEKNKEIRGITSLLNTKKAMLKKNEDLGNLIDDDIKNLAKAGGGKKRRRKKQSKRRSKKRRSSKRRPKRRSKKY